MTFDLSSGITLFVTIVLVAIWIWAFYDVIFVNSASTSEKLFWIIILLVFNLIGIIFYVLLARKESDYEIVKRK